jgi:solute carrier family 25 protein 16
MIYDAKTAKSLIAANENTSSNSNDANNKQNKKQHFSIYSFISGGIAGCVAKSLVAPIDRVKILLQVHNKHYEGFGIFEAFYRVKEKEGFCALYKGNVVQLIRIFPYAALQFSSYETYKSLNKKIFKKNADNLINSFACGSLAGTKTFKNTIIKAINPIF